MDHRDALKRLEVVRPGSRDLDDPELAEVARMLDQSEELRRQFEALQSLDRRIGAAIRDVTIPAEMKDRLIAIVRVAGNPAQTDPGDDIETGSELSRIESSDRRSGRRNVMLRRWRPVAGAVLAAALLPIFGFLVWHQPRRIELTVVEIQRKVPLDSESLSRLPPFDEQLFGLPDTVPFLERSGIVRGWTRDADTPHMLAIYSSPRPAKWTLIVAPAKSITNGASSESGTAVLIRGRWYQTDFWVAGEYTYVLFVEGDSRDLDRVHEQVRGIQV